jgi:phage gpG-like protein
MGIQVQVFGKTELVAKYKRISAALPSILQNSMNTQMVKLADYVRSSKLSGDPLNRRSGRLSRSISGSASTSGKIVTGVVGSKGVPYAHVHETGGDFEIPSHQRIISMVFGRPIVPKSITIGTYTAHFPQRAFLKPSLSEKQSDIIEELRMSVLGAMRAA